METVLTEETMTKIYERQFINQFTGGDAGIDINQLSEETKKVLEGAGVDLSEMDSNHDGIIKGKKELSQLFKVVDGFDSATDRKIETTYDKNMPTVGGLVNKALVEEFNRSASMARMTGPKHKGTAGEKTAASASASDLSSLPPTFDKGFYLKLAEAPEDELRLWYHEQARQDPKFVGNVRECYTEVFNNAKLNGSEKAKLDKLGDRLQQFQNERSGAWAMEKYGKQSQNEMAKGFIDRIQIAEQKSGAAGRRAEINEILEDLQFLSVSQRGKSGKAYAKALVGLKQAMLHQYPEGGKLVDAMPRAEVIDAAERLQGAGSAAVKADLIKVMLQNRPTAQQMTDLTAQFGGRLPKEMLKIIAENSLDKDKADDLLKKLEKFEKVPGQAKEALEKVKSLTTGISDEKYPGGFIEGLLQSDPGGIAREFEAMARDPKNPDKMMLDHALTAVYRAHRTDPQKAADLVGEMLGKATEELAAVSQKRPFDDDQIREIKNYGHGVGFLLESAKNMVKTISEDKKAVIDEGAFIAGIFSKAVSKLTNFPGIKEVGDEVISGLKDKEYKQVDKWQMGVESGYFQLLDTIIYAGKPDSRSGPKKEDFDKDLQFIYDDIRDGMASHAELQAR